MKASMTSTIKADEAAHFGALAADWWDPKGSSAMLHKLNPVRLGFVRNRVNAHWGLDRRTMKPLETRTVLDVGCGAGLMCEPLAKTVVLYGIIRGITSRKSSRIRKILAIAHGGHDTSWFSPCHLFFKFFGCNEARKQVKQNGSPSEGTNCLRKHVRQDESPGMTPPNRKRYRHGWIDVRATYRIDCENSQHDRDSPHDGYLPNSVLSIKQHRRVYRTASDHHK